MELKGDKRKDSKKYFKRKVTEQGNYEQNLLPSSSHDTLLRNKWFGSVYLDFVQNIFKGGKNTSCEFITDFHHKESG